MKYWSVVMSHILKTSIVFFSIFFNILTATSALLNCPDENVYVQRNPYLRCKKIVNCRPGYEIIDCENNCEPLKCMPCKLGYVQPDLIHWNSKYQSCFKAHPKFSCTGNHLKPKVQSLGEEEDLFCPQAKACKCRNDNCFYGNDPCLCRRKFKECGINETLNSDTGICEPCPEGHSKLAGCGACLRNPIMESTTKLPTITKPSIESTPEDSTRGWYTTATVIQNVTTAYYGFFEDSATTPVDSGERLMATFGTKNASEQTHHSYVLVGSVIFVALIIFIVVAILRYKYEKCSQHMNDTDEETRFVENGRIHQERHQDTPPLARQNRHVTCNINNGILKQKTNNERKRNINNAPEGEGRLLNECDDNENVDENCNNKVDDVKIQHTILADSLAVKQSLKSFQRQQITSDVLPNSGPSNIDHIINTPNDQINTDSLHSGVDLCDIVHTNGCVSKTPAAVLPLAISKCGQPVSPESESPGVHPLTVSTHPNQLSIPNGRKSSTLQARNKHGLRLSTRDSMTDNKKPVAYPTDDSHDYEKDDFSQPKSIKSNQKADEMHCSQTTDDHYSYCMTIQERQLKPLVENEEDTERKPVFRKSFEDSGFDTNR